MGVNQFYQMSVNLPRFTAVNPCAVLWLLQFYYIILYVVQNILRLGIVFILLKNVTTQQFAPKKKFRQHQTVTIGYWFI